MSLLQELVDTVVEGQEVIAPGLYESVTVQLSTVTYNFEQLGGNGPFLLPLSVPLPKGAIVLNAMFNIFVTPVGPDSVFMELGNPVLWNITSPNPIGVPWNQGTVPYQFGVNSKVLGEPIETASLVFNNVASAGHFSVTFYYVL